VYGPYKRREVLAQGKTEINGPHQGGWVTTESGEDWFVHFQDRGAYGRVVLLEPMQWKRDWPMVGVNQDANGVGEPVTEFRKPAIAHPGAIETPPDSDEFDTSEIGKQWQWQANPRPGWALPSAALGVLRLMNVVADPGSDGRIWTLPNVLSQKFSGPEFIATTKITASNFHAGDRAGLVVTGRNYAYLALRQDAAGLLLVSGRCQDAEHDCTEIEATVARLDAPTIYLRMRMKADNHASFEYSRDDKTYLPAGDPFRAAAGVWIGAKLGLFAQGQTAARENGYIDVDWLRLTK
jgi:beta-xylosidase